jgi:iron-sulfur cluster repair protein YtfE (RIC family)
MSALIEEFKKEHSEIIEALKEVKELGVLTKEGHAKLMYLLPDLLKHLWNEDERLYPVLWKASKHNKKLKEILSSFINGLGAIYEEVLEFMTKYCKGVMDSNFQEEYERLFDALCKRIWYEESVLYDEYNKINY